MRGTPLRRPTGRRLRLLALAGVPLAALAALPAAGPAAASTPAADVRLSNDAPGTTGYVSDYTAVTGQPYTDAALTECSRARGRQNEPAVAVNPRNPQVIVGSSNDYCATYDDGADADGAPLPVGPIWLGYYRSENGGASFQLLAGPGLPRRHLAVRGPGPGAHRERRRPGARLGRRRPAVRRLGELRRPGRQQEDLRRRVGRHVREPGRRRRRDDQRRQGVPPVGHSRQGLVGA